MHRILSLVLLFLTTSTFVPASGNDGAPFVRMTLVPPATMDEDVATPRGTYRGFEPLDGIRVDTRPPSGMMPEDMSHEFFPEETVQIDDVGRQRDWPVTVFEWEATDFCHRPLYFEHKSLEVGGHSINQHLQPILSGARFFASVPLLPVKLFRTPPHVHISTLGHGCPDAPTPCLPHACAH